MSWFSALRSNGQQTTSARQQYEDEQYQEEIVAQFYLSFPKLECVCNDYCDDDKLSAGVASVQGWRVNQEDAHICDLNFDPVNRLALFAIFDGHNGPEIACYAAKHLPQLIKDNSHYWKKDYGKALEEAFLQFDSSLLDNDVNNELKNISHQYELCYGRIKRRQTSPLLAMVTGSTAVVALLCKQNGQLHVSNIGDSRCAIYNKNKSHPMTLDHKPTDAKELKRIEMSGSRVINGRINSGLNLSRAFGDYMLKSNGSLGPKEQAVIAWPDLTVSNEKFRRNDFIVLACDGIWNSMNEKEACSVIKKCIKKKMKPSKICQEVIQRCISPVRPIDGQNGGDNMTCIVVKFEQDLP
ncbi:hypothetical protein DERP_008130 [Dermatophagoides pteronyssinus]|uniref:protein-serine/threonine phosphatase n=1 Tax=Dermatophagoides pteronyssinus TaxID=6956 RepID=A0ABQ8JK94_DERPT|nr:hypothetical protein DERP_008130 [Dermatophagoides pteronyssinus]